MTTIATDGKSMAGDGMSCSMDMVVTTGRKKVHRLGDGRIVGCSGNSANIIRFVAWLEGGDKPEIKDSFAALILEADGSTFQFCEQLVPMPVDLPAALGSGVHFAVGAMLAGASPRRAVEIASSRDPHSGGDIHSEAL
jgi:ATP-dependent protease HslVU (ClpYQ) peptidase subunit